MTDLPDINVWLALADENHTLHSAARHYWQNTAAASVVFCRISMLGFLRLSTHRSVLSRPLSPTEAWSIYQQYRNHAGVGFLHEPPSIDAEFKTFTCLPGFEPNLWTDAYLAALALSTGCRLVSFDADFGSFAGLHFMHLTAAE
jgi:toxin-antitoxin system PIN domain toxin